MAQRRKLLINLSLQSEFILTVFLVCLLILLVNLANVYVLFSQFISAQASAEEIVVANKLIGTALTETRGRLILLGMVNLVIVFCIGLFMSHRFAGPAFKMEREMRQIQGGDLTARVHLRDGDQLTDLAGGFNRMAEGLTELQAEAVEAGQDLIRKTREVCVCAGTGGVAGPDDFGEVSEGLLASAERLEKALSVFTFPEKRA